MKKALSSWTGTELAQYVGALGWDYKTTARRLKKSPAAVSCYVNGSMRIPLEVETQIEKWYIEQRQKLSEILGRQVMSLTEVIAATNELRGPSRGPTYDKFSWTDDTTPYAPYRMRPGRFPIVKVALEVWRDEVVHRSHKAGDLLPQFHREHLVAKQILSSLPAHSPYDIVITACEWKVVSRALRHFGRTDQRALAIYQMWRRGREKS